MRCPAVVTLSPHSGDCRFRPGLRLGAFPIMPTEKQTRTVAVRLSERMEYDLMRLAAASDRSVSDYLRAVLADHMYGHSRILQAAPCERQEARGLHCERDGCDRSGYDANR